MEATRVTIDEIKERLDRGEEFTFLDTRNAQAWSEATTKLPGAIRVDAKFAFVEDVLRRLPRFIDRLFDFIPNGHRSLRESCSYTYAGAKEELRDWRLETGGWDDG